MRAMKALEKPSVWRVFAKIKAYALGVFAVFLVTLGIFPSSIVHIIVKAPNNRFFGDLFQPFAFLNFNMCDFAGRGAAGFVKVTPSGGTWLSIPIVVRFVFFPLFLFCYMGVNKPIGTWFEEPEWPILFMVSPTHHNHSHYH